MLLFVLLLSDTFCVGVNISMKNRVKVSIIVPIYNIEKYLEKCIKSLIFQTYNNIEIILVDDGSTDKSAIICDEFASKDKRIEVIHKENGGLSSAREAGITAATGDYVMIVDGDDWLDSHTIQSCINVLEENRNVDCVLFSYVKEFENNSIPMHVMDGTQYFSKKEAEDKIYRRLFGLSDAELSHPERMDNVVSCCMKLYKTEIARKGKYYDTKVVGSSEDTLFNMYALYKSGEMVYLDECFYHYRKSSTSLTNVYRKDLDKKWNRLFCEMNRIIEEKKLGSEYRKALSNRIALSIVGIGMNEVGNIKSSHLERYKKVIRCTFISRIAPHVFTIYLINDHPMIRRYFWKEVLHCDSIAGSNFMILHWLGCTIGFMMSGILLDYIGNKLIKYIGNHGRGSDRK